MARLTVRGYINAMSTFPLRSLLGAAALCLAAACSAESQNTDLDSSVDNATASCELKWGVDNVVPCIAAPDLLRSPPTPALIYSSHLVDAKDENGKAIKQAQCEPYVGFPQPTPKDAWSPQRVRGETAGEGTLCISLKHGQADKPSDADCTLVERCVEVSYDTPGETRELPALEGWSASDADCSNSYYETGGYVELRITSDQLGCSEAGDDVKRIQFCPPGCKTDGSDPRPLCANCRDVPAVSGAF